MVAINDAFILESCIYIFLKKYFKKTDYYVDLLELFHEVSIKKENYKEKERETDSLEIGYFPN